MERDKAEGDRRVQRIIDQGRRGRSTKTAASHIMADAPL